MSRVFPAWSDVGRTGLWTAVALSLALVAAHLICRPLLPIDETRYLAVAWDMHASGDYLVPHLNGETYSHKPPLLFWLINAIWAVTGVHEWSARLVAPLAGILSLVLTSRIARRLWPEFPAAAGVAPLVLATSTLWLLFVSMTMFDTLLTVATLSFLLGLLRASVGDRAGFLVMALAIGGGLLTKGPVCLLHTLPAALLAPLWSSPRSAGQWLRWYGAIVLSISGGAALALCWAIPAASAGGPEYADAILWGQTAGRLERSFAHARPIWWYVPLLPFFALPWAFAWRAWRTIPMQTADRGVRLCLIWLLVPLVVFSLISGKQIHYFIPELPALALLLAFAVSRKRSAAYLLNASAVGIATAIWGGLLIIRPLLSFLPVKVSAPELCSPWCGLPIAFGGLWILWGPKLPPAQRTRQIATFAVLNSVLMLFGLRAGLLADFHIDPIAQHVAELQRAGIPVAHEQEYHGELHFAGRLTAPITELRSRDDVARWQSQHPEGVVIRAAAARNDPGLETAEVLHRYRRDMTIEWVGACRMASAREESDCF